MMAFFIVHNGPLPRFFSPLLFRMVLGEDNDIHPTLDDLYKYDEDLATRVSKVKRYFITWLKQYTGQHQPANITIDIAW